LGYGIAFGNLHGTPAENVRTPYAKTLRLVPNGLAFGACGRYISHHAVESGERADFTPLAVPTMQLPGKCRFDCETAPLVGTLPKCINQLLKK